MLATFKYAKPRVATQPGRLYVDDSTAIIINSYLGKLSGKQAKEFHAMAMPKGVVFRIARNFKKSARESVVGKLEKSTGTHKPPAKPDKP